MRRLPYIIIITFFWTGCKHSNTDFNPFDQDFQFHKNFNVADYDTIMGECGYWNLTKRIDGTYYQFFDNKKEIVAKGFNVAFDEITISNYDSLEHNELMTKAIKEYSFDINTIKQSLQKFQLKEIKFRYDTSLFPAIEMVDEEDSTHYASLTLEFDGKDKIVREVRYFNGKNY